MCYHYSISKTADEIAGRYNITPRPPGINPDPVCYHANGFEFRSLPAVYQDNTKGDLKMDFMQWGLVPGWVKGEEQAQKIRQQTLNARAETVDTKPSFRFSFQNRPCLVPATGYFEWMHHGGKKFPFFISIPGTRIFSFAGVWDEWVNEQSGEILRSFSLITCEANSFTARIHNTKKRMPVILDEDSENQWLDIGQHTTGRKALLKPFDSRMKAYTIGRLITDRKHNSDSPEVLDPVIYPGLNQVWDEQ
jgi:putative SOS response-associated peptidase YedK